MPSHSLVTATLLVIALTCSAHAETRKCTGRDGRVTYSDVACPDRTQSERSVETNGNTLDASELREKVQKDKAQAEQAQTQERLQASARQQAQAQEAQTARQAAEKDSAAYAACVREVEQQSPAENVKAELFAACRTAGASQRQTGMTEAALRECIQNVERTGVFGNDKARQLASCHGADVKPEPVVVVLPATRVRAQSPKMICEANQCKDDKGRRYTRQGEAMLRDDGKVCRLINFSIQCP